MEGQASVSAGAAPGRGTSESPRPPGPHRSACDSCRRRKIKCDGNQPCNRCSRSGIACTFGSTTNRNAVSYVRRLEQQVVELSAQVQHYRLSDTRPPSEQTSQPQGQDGSNLPIDMLVGPGDDHVYRVPRSSSNIFHGRFAAVSVLRSIGDMCARFAPPGTSINATSGNQLAEAFESNTLSPPQGQHSRLFALLPPKEQIIHLSLTTFDFALTCHDCIDREEFFSNLDRFYEIDVEDYSVDDHKFMALLYATLALGRRYEPSGQAGQVDAEVDKFVMKGLSYFRASIEAFDILDCNDLNSIRTTILQTFYLLSASMMSQAYMRHCTGAAAALRMGLHMSDRDLDGGYSSRELFSRRQVFAVLNMMDTYVASLIGLPKILRDADEEQNLGLPEGSLADHGLSFLSENASSSISESILCQQLFNIIAKIINVRFPLRKESASPGLKDSAFSDDIAQWQTEMEQWHETLPNLTPNPTDRRSLNAQLLLRLVYSLGQLILYRPFLHHLARERRDPEFNYRGYECGSACVRAAMQLVWIGDTINNQGLLHEAHWFYSFNICLAGYTLAFFVLCTKQGPTVQECTAAAHKACDLLYQQGQYNLSAKSCYNSLSAVVDTFPMVVI